MQLSKRIIKYLIFINIISILFSMPVLSNNYLDLGNFESMNGGYWALEGDNTTVIQVDKIDNERFYLTQENIINKVITGKIKVSSFTYDNDAFGLTVGYQGINNNYLWSWDAGGMHGTEGHIFYKKEGPVNHDDIPGELLYDGRAVGEAWKKEKEYNFKVTYLENYFELEINNRKIIEVKDDFPKGRFGFYCFSQDMIYFSNITIQNGEHLLKPELEELDQPIEIKGGVNKSDNNLFDIINADYRITNNSEYDIENLYISLAIDPDLKLVADSINITQTSYDLKYDTENNNYKLSGISLKSKESINLNYFLKKRQIQFIKDKYFNTISIKSSNKNILLSNFIKTKLKFNNANNNLNSVIIGSINVNKNSSYFNVNNSGQKFKILTSDGRLIQVDKNGRFHLTVNKFNGIYDEEILVLKLIVPKRYNKYSLSGEKIKLLKVKPGSYIKQDFNLYTGGKLNG
ncbi:MAG: hypothetical protein K9K76_03900 [Halanaerobiales bacterium]|nr:hypothetical protein [Halanaerobiales bacterium]